ncbi:MAG: non-homologous end-joining DNA ligase [Rhodomicrobium sp.]|jgi:bifunctional non-homologous end joining protein LigD
MAAKKKAARAPARIGFIESMECLPVPTLPEGKEWSYEIKLDGFRLEAVKQKGETTLYSRRGNILNRKFPNIAAALEGLPDDTILDGEVVALDEQGRSDFNLLQNFRSAESKIHYYVFDILALKGRDVSTLPLAERRKILDKALKRNDHVSTSPAEAGSSAKILTFVKQHGLEGVVAKRFDSFYEPGKRSGAWCKYRINLGQEFVVGGYTPGGNGFDALILGFYRGKDLFFAARVRAGFVPATRRQVFAKIKELKTDKCPFVNLPEQSEGRWGQGLTAEKMKSCVWVKPKVVVRVDFAEWTGADKLRHTKFIGLREDKDPRKVVRET